MAKIISEYKGDLRCLSRHEDLSEEIVTDAPKENRGKGDFFSPTDLFATALGTCMATVMGIQANILKIDLKGMTFTVDKEMTTDRPNRVRKLSVAFFIPCNPDDHQKALLEKAAKACPIHHSLHPDIEQSVVFNWQA